MKIKNHDSHHSIPAWNGVISSYNEMLNVLYKDINSKILKLFYMFCEYWVHYKGL